MEGERSVPLVCGTSCPRYGRLWAPPNSRHRRLVSGSRERERLTRRRQTPQQTRAQHTPSVSPPAHSAPGNSRTNQPQYKQSREPSTSPHQGRRREQTQCPARCNRHPGRVCAVRAYEPLPHPSGLGAAPGTTLFVALGQPNHPRPGMHAQAGILMLPFHSHSDRCPDINADKPTAITRLE